MSADGRITRYNVNNNKITAIIKVTLLTKVTPLCGTDFFRHAGNKTQ